MALDKLFREKMISFKPASAVENKSDVQPLSCSLSIFILTPKKLLFLINFVHLLEMIQCVNAVLTHFCDECHSRDQDSMIFFREEAASCW